MKAVSAVCFLAFAAVVFARPNDKPYTDKYDNIDINMVLETERLFNAYVDCILDIGKCTPESKELKSHITEALQNKCKLCTNHQRDGTKQVISFMINKKPEIWEKMKAKYDPENKYSPLYEEDLKELKN